MIQEYENFKIIEGINYPFSFSMILTLFSSHIKFVSCALNIENHQSEALRDELWKLIDGVEAKLSSEHNKNNEYTVEGVCEKLPFIEVLELLREATKMEDMGFLQKKGWSVEKCQNFKQALEGVNPVLPIKKMEKKSNEQFNFNYPSPHLNEVPGRNFNIETNHLTQVQIPILNEPPPSYFKAPQYPSPIPNFNNTYVPPHINNFDYPRSYVVEYDPPPYCTVNNCIVKVIPTTLAETYEQLSSLHRPPPPTHLQRKIGSFFSSTQDLNKKSGCYYVTPYSRKF